MTFDELKEKYKDGWWEGHDGYSGDEMCSDILELLKEVDFLRKENETISDNYDSLLGLKKEAWQIHQENKELKAKVEQQSKEIEKLYNDTHFLQSKLLEEKDITNKYWVKLVQLEQENKTLKRRDNIE